MSIRKINSCMLAGLLLISANTLYAQKGQITIGARAGGNVSKLCCGTKEMNKDYEFRTAYNGGLTVAYGFNKYLSLVLEADYISEGAKRTGMQTLMPVSSLQTTSYQRYADYTLKEKLDYLQVPLMARATFGNKIKYYVNAGPYIGFLLNAKMETSGNSPLYLDKNKTKPEITNGYSYSFEGSYDVKSQLNTINFGIAGGLGAGYSFGKHAIWLDGRYDLGLTNIRQNTVTNGENSTGAILLDIGYSYSLFSK